MPIECSIDVVVIRANGYREDLGRVCYWHRDFLKRMEHKVKQFWYQLPNGLWAIGAVGIAPHHDTGHMWIVPAISTLPLFLTVLQVNTGRAIVTNRIHGAGTEPLFQGWGTGSGLVSATSTTLSTEVDVNLSSTTGTRTTGVGAQATTATTNDTYRVTAIRTATGSGSVLNAGLFDNATIASGNLYMAGDTLNVALSSGDSISFTNSVQYS